MLVLPILLPLLGGLWLFLAKPKEQKKMLYFFLLSTAILVFTLPFVAPEEILFGHFPFDVVFAFQIDEMSLLFSVLFVVVWWIVLRYSLVFLEEDPEKNRFFAAFLSLLGALIGLCYAHNLMTFYLFFEMVSLCSVVLVGHERTEEAILACKKFFYYSMAGAFMGMISIFYFYSIKSTNPYVDSMKFEAGGNELLLTHGNPEYILGFTLLAVLGFGCKAEMFPLHGWLKAVYPVAPGPASAILSGITTKAGILGILRILYYMVGPEMLRGTYVQFFGILLAVITIFMGSTLAYRDKMIQTRLAYSTVSQIGYVMFGLFIFQQYAFVGAILQILFHAMAKTLLFLCAGTIIRETGVRKVAEFGGLGKKIPRTFLLLTVASFSLVGLPFTGGFVSKWYIAIGAGGSSGGFFGVTVIMLSALLTAGYLLPLCTEGFFGKVEESEGSEGAKVSEGSEESKGAENGVLEDVRHPKWEPVTYWLAGFLCVFGIYPTPLIEVLLRVAETLGMGGGL